MKAYFTFILLSLACCLTAQINFSDTATFKAMDRPYQEFRLNDRIQSFIYQNKAGKRWELHVTMPDSVPLVEIVGEWVTQSDFAGYMTLRPVGYKAAQFATLYDTDTLAIAIISRYDQLTTIERYAALESIKDAIERALGPDKVPDSPELLRLISINPLFKHKGRIIDVENQPTRLFYYMDIVSLLDKLR